MKSIDYLNKRDVEFKLIEFEEMPHTASDVERLYGCSLGQVLKTLLFIGDKEPILVVIPGDKKVDLEKLKNATNQNEIRIATPEEVKNVTDYSIGGVSPFGIENIKKVIDGSVFKVTPINVGSGKAEIGIEMSSDELKKVWGGDVFDILKNVK